MTEEAVCFGQDGCLVGVIAAPHSTDSCAKHPAVLLLNAGLLHRVGPYRLYVDLARKICELGYLAFRFDLSGLGDSMQGDDARLYDERVLDNIRSAMDLLSAEYGIQRFVLMGLCAGADNAHKAAVRDARVTGVVYFDGYGYRTPGYYLHHYLRKMFNLDSYRNFVQRKLIRSRGGPGVEQEVRPVRGRVFVRRFPPKSEVEREVQEMIARGVRLLYVYTGGVRYTYYNHRRQFQAMFRSVNSGGQAQAEYIPHAEHTFPSTADRELLISTVCRWMRQHFP